MRVRLLFACVLTALVPLACSSAAHHAERSASTTQAPSSVPGSALVRIAIPTEGPGGGHMEAALRGPLAFDGGCFHMGTTVIVWPHGFHAQNDPPRIIDDSGRVFARVGEVIRLGGGGAPTNMTAQQLVAQYPPLRACLPRMACYVRPSTQYGCLNDVWFA